MESAASQPARNVGRLVEHADNNRNCSIVSDPIATRLDPQAVGTGEVWIGALRREPRGRTCLDLPTCLLQRCDQPASRLGAFTVLVMLAKFPELPCRPRRKSDQRRRVFLLAFLAAALASSRARLSRRSRMTTSPETIRPAARSASLSARTSSHPAGAMEGVGVSSINRILGECGPEFQPR